MEDQQRRDVAGLLEHTDEQYQILSEPGEILKVWFPVIPQAAGTKRSLFLKTSGYYKIHVPTDKPEQTDLIRRLITVEGGAVEFALDQYLSWRGQILGTR